MTAALDSATTQAAAFVVGELLPTVGALVAAAGREPLGWVALALCAAVARRLHRR